MATDSGQVHTQSMETPKDIDEVIEVCKYPIPALEPAAKPEIDLNKEEQDVWVHWVIYLFLLAILKI